MRDQEWDSALAQLHSLDLAKLVFGLLGLDAVDGEASLGVVDEAEVLAGLLDGDDVHETSWVGGIGADLSINLDKALHDNSLGLARVKRILETVADEDDERHAVAELVWTWGWTRRVGTGQFVQKPVRRRTQALLVLLSVQILLAHCSFGHCRTLISRSLVESVQLSVFQTRQARRCLAMSNTKQQTLSCCSWLAGRHCVKPVTSLFQNVPSFRPAIRLPSCESKEYAKTGMFESREYLRSSTHVCVSVDSRYKGLVVEGCRERVANCWRNVGEAKYRASI